MYNIQCRCGRVTSLASSGVQQTITCPECRAPIRMVGQANPTMAGESLSSLQIDKGPIDTGGQYFLGGSEDIEIGKLPGKTLRLEGSLVSRNHCRLIRRGEEWAIEDHNSTNGLFVNGERVEDRLLEDGDVVQIGDYELTYHAGQPSAAVPVAAATAAAARRAAARPIPAPAAARPAPAPKFAASPLTARGQRCPSCDKILPTAAKICTDCGIHLPSGKPVLVVHDVDADILQHNATRIIGPLSWFLPVGLFPIASEGFGLKKPLVIWSLAIVTVICSMIFMVREMSGGDMRSAKSLMLWHGSQEPDVLDILIRYQALPNYGDESAWVAKIHELAQEPSQKTHAEIGHDSTLAEFIVNRRGERAWCKVAVA